MKGRDKMIHSFLLIGQSNMAGRGYINEVELINNPRIKVLRNGRWQDMFVPVNPDRPFSGINLAESFCDEYSREHDTDVGIIPCADGGTALSQWAEGSLLFDNAVYQCTLAQRTSSVAGILWHQGEGDCSDELYPLYFDKFTKLITAMRTRLGLENTPLLIGENVTIGHGAIVHGCTIGNNSLIGMGAIILNNAVIGNNCIVGAGALVTQNTIIPDNSLVIGNPAKIKRTVRVEEIKDIADNAVHYVNEASLYLK